MSRSSSALGRSDEPAARAAVARSSTLADAATEQGVDLAQEVDRGGGVTGEHGGLGQREQGVGGRFTLGIAPSPPEQVSNASVARSRASSGWPSSRQIQARTFSARGP